MTFLHPSLALAAVLMAACPIVLHLLLRRPRATPWPSNMLLQRAMERMRRRRRLERWMLLALRALGIGLVGLAMSGPLASGWGDSLSRRERWIVLDDAATSAERIADGQSMLDHLKRQALSSIDALRSGDRVAIVTTATPAEVLVQPTTDLARARNVVSGLRTRPLPGDLRGAIELCLPGASDANPRDVLVLTGWRRGSVDPERPLPAAWLDRARNVAWEGAALLAPAPGNRSIRDGRIMRSTRELQGSGDITVRVNMGRVGTNSDVDSVLVRSAAGDTIGQSTFRWSPQALDRRVEVVARLAQDGAIRIDVPSDAQPLDDSIALVVPATTAPRVVIVGRRGGETDMMQLPASTWIQRALESTGMQPQEMDPASLTLRPPTDAEAIIVCRPDLLDGSAWSWLGQFVRDGGTTIVMPPPDGSTQSWVQQLDRSLGLPTVVTETPITGSERLAARQPRSPMFALLGAEIDALAEPVTMQRRLRLVSGAAGSEATLLFEHGDPAMLVQRPSEGHGVVVLLAFTPDLAWTDLPLKPLMVPLFQEAVRAGRMMAASRQDLRAGDIGWLGSSARNGILIPREEGLPTIEIDADGRTRSTIPAPGLWKVRQRDSRERWVAVRLDPAAASIEALDETSIDLWRRGVGAWRGTQDAEQIERSGIDSPWTLPLLCLALACLLTESFISRIGSPRSPRSGEAVTT